MGGDTSFNIIVTIKQVPDTQAITGEAMTAEGTVNRGALPAIVNPEDLNALEEALKIKDRFGAHITVLTMGPPSAATALKECYYRGADDCILLSDRKFAGADTLATSLTLYHAIQKIGKFDIIFCGRQAIDGDTAHVVPHLAEKLDINQITCVSSVIEVTDKSISVERITEYGFEQLKSPYPLLLTVNNEANKPRSPSAIRLLGYKRMEFSKADVEKPAIKMADKLQKDRVHFQLWNIKDIQCDPSSCGLKGSPTMVKKIENVVLETKDIKNIPNREPDIKQLIHELLEDHIIG